MVPPVSIPRPAVASAPRAASRSPRADPTLQGVRSHAERDRLLRLDKGVERGRPCPLASVGCVSGVLRTVRERTGTTPSEGVPCRWPLAGVALSPVPLGLALVALVTVTGLGVVRGWPVGAVGAEVDGVRPSLLTGHSVSPFGVSARRGLRVPTPTDGQPPVSGR